MPSNLSSKGLQSHSPGLQVLIRKQRRNLAAASCVAAKDMPPMIVCVGRTGVVHIVNAPAIKRTNVGTRIKIRDQNGGENRKHQTHKKDLKQMRQTLRKNLSSM